MPNFSPCVSANGVDQLQGICLPLAVCSMTGGQSVGRNNCKFLSTCCVCKLYLAFHLKSYSSANKKFNVRYILDQVSSKCDVTPVVTLNNTYWQSPSVRSSNNCGLVLQLNSKLTEQQMKPICQIR